jgi:uncharacterized membrane protein YhaH (DUF805 family)
MSVHEPRTGIAVGGSCGPSGPLRGHHGLVDDPVAVEVRHDRRIVDMLIGTYDDAADVGLLQGLFTLAVLVPYISATARRLHDTGKSGWRQLLFLIPLVGLIIWIIWTATEGDSGANKYGPDPKYAPATSLT